MKNYKAIISLLNEIIGAEFKLELDKTEKSKTINQYTDTFYLEQLYNSCIEVLSYSIAVTLINLLNSKVFNSITNRKVFQLITNCSFEINLLEFSRISVLGCSNKDEESFLVFYNLIAKYLKDIKEYIKDKVFIEKKSFLSYSWKDNSIPYWRRYTYRRNEA